MSNLKYFLLYLGLFFALVGLAIYTVNNPIANTEATVVEFAIPAEVSSAQRDVSLFQFYPLSTFDDGSRIISLDNGSLWVANLYTNGSGYRAVWSLNGKEEYKQDFLPGITYVEIISGTKLHIEETSYGPALVVTKP